MPTTGENQEPGNAALAMRSADEFRNLSQPFLAFTGTDLNTSQHKAVQHLGGMIASATSLALAVELYLKAAHLLRNKHAPRTHDLWALFKNLPEPTKTSILSVYDSIPLPPLGIAVSFNLEITKGPFENDIPPRPSSAPDNSLPGVLARCKDAFQTWRYLYEQGEQDRVMTFTYEFHNLNRAAESVRRQVAPYVKFTMQGNTPENP